MVCVRPHLKLASAFVQVMNFFQQVGISCIIDGVRANALLIPKQRAALHSYIVSHPAKSRFLGEGMDKITYASLGSLGSEFHETFDAAIGHVREDLEETHPLFIGGKPRK